MLSETFQNHVEELIQQPSGHSVSLFMPTHRTGKEQQQDPIRLKNLIREARSRTDEEAGSAIAEEVLKPVDELRFDDEFWLRRERGLACFCMSGFFRAYHVPIEVSENVYVSNRFHIRPLLPLLQGDASIFVLALTQESARLYEATKYTIDDIDLPRIRRIELEDSERPHQFHSHQAPTGGKGATDEAIFHGHGGPADRSKTDTLRYFQLVNAEIMGKLQGRKAPLVLACVGYLAHLYAEANSYRHLIRDKVPGSPDRWRDDELRAHAWQLVEPLMQREQEDAWRKFQRLKDREGASADVRNIAAAADEGRVETLFLVRDEEWWEESAPRRGHTVEKQGEKHNQRIELLDLAAVRTVSNGGSVYVMESLPEVKSPGAAVFRY